MSRHISTVRSYECILYYNKNIVETAKDSDLQAFGPGWRVEFRPLELQLTDFENAAYYGLLSSNIGGDNENDSDSDKIRTKLFDLYMPLSYVEENLRFFFHKICQWILRRCCICRCIHCRQCGNAVYSVGILQSSYYQAMIHTYLDNLMPRMATTLNVLSSNST